MISNRVDNRTVLVAMSGGVDSSLAAVLLAEEGYSVIGMTMRLWDHAFCGRAGVHDTPCCLAEAADQARAVCASLGIPHYVANFSRQFRDQVVANFVTEYLSGRTPNPCVLCNRRLKWEILLDKGRQLGAACLATGHYARTGKDADSGRYMLSKGLDAAKDQSYFLWMLTQAQLARTLFPLGAMTKTATRQKARAHHLGVSEKRESQEICFIPEDNYRKFLEEITTGPVPTKGTEWDSLGVLPGKGPIRDSQGRMLGEHAGFPFYTIGQRKGLGLAAGYPLYVVRIDAEENTVYVGQECELYQDQLIASDLNWVSIGEPQEPRRCRAKIRYKHEPAEAVLIPLPAQRIGLRFDTAQRAITPGQSVVFYDGDVVLGGGIIAEGIRS